MRRVIAQRNYRKLRAENRAHQEALRLKELEQKQLEKQIGKKKAKEVAEMNFQERLDDFQRKDEEREMLERDKIRHNAERMENIKMRNDQPIDDSAVVDDMFGFLEDQKDNVSESQAPSAFRDLPAPKVKHHFDSKTFYHFTAIIFNLDYQTSIFVHEFIYSNRLCKMVT